MTLALLTKYMYNVLIECCTLNITHTYALYQMMNVTDQLSLPINVPSTSSLSLVTYSISTDMMLSNMQVRRSLPKQNENTTDNYSHPSGD